MSATSSSSANVKANESRAASAREKVVLPTGKDGFADYTSGKMVPTNGTANLTR